MTERVIEMSDVKKAETKKKWKKRPDPVVIYKKWCKACFICVEMWYTVFHLLDALPGIRHYVN
jgi:hypothetical protein